MDGEDALPALNQHISSCLLMMKVPRACSTVFERAMMNRPDVFETFHEPRGIPYYYGPAEERGSRRYKDSPVRKSHAEVTASIAKVKAAAPPGSLVFIKDMAYYLCDSSGNMDRALLAEVLDVVDINTFLIRNPAKQVKSLHEMSTTQKETVGWDEFIPAEVGYVELAAVHSALVAEGRPAVIIDADDVLRDPEPTLRQYCQHAGISFSDHMLHWEPNEERIVRKFAEWGGWHDSAISSSGWEKPKRRCDAPVQPLLLPPTARGSSGGPEVKTAAASVVKKGQEQEAATVQLIEECIAEANVFYTQLFERRVLSGGAEAREGGESPPPGHTSE